MMTAIKNAAGQPAASANSRLDDINTRSEGEPILMPVNMGSPYPSDGAAHSQNLTTRTINKANPLQPLQDLIDLGRQPFNREFWLFLGTTPNKINGLPVDAQHLPNDNDCKVLAGLDIVLTFNGYLTNYGTLRRLCGSILAARPNLFMVIDLDYKKNAQLKIGARAC